MENQSHKEDTALYKKISIIITVLLFVISCSNKTKEELFSEGVKQLKENNPNSAIIYLKNALEKDPIFFDARFQLAKAYLATGKYESAESELLKLSRQNPASKEVKIELARAYIRLSKPDEALKELTEYINDPNNIEAVELAGLAHAIKGNYATAESLLKKAALHSNSDSRITISLAHVYSEMGKNEDANEHLKAVLKKEPNNKSALHLLADLQKKEKNFDDALKIYDQILNANDSDIEALSKKCLLLIDKQKYEEALALSEEIIKKLPKRPEGYRIKGITLFHLKQFDKAIVELQKSLAIYPNLSAHYFLALSHYYKNEPEQALTHLQKAYEINPRFTQAKVMTSIILLRQKRIDEAINEAKKALEKDEGNALAHNILGSAYLAKGMHSEGIEQFNKAIAIDPKLIDVHIKKGILNFGKGRIKEAEAELKTAVQINPEILDTRMILAAYYLKQNEYNKALNVLNEGLKGDKADAVLLNFISDILLRQNKADEAFKYLHKAKKLNPEYDATYFRLASLYIFKGEPDKGTNELKSLIEKTPDNLKALLALASISESNNQDAHKYYLKAKETGKIEGHIELANYQLRKKETEKAHKTLDEAISKNKANVQLLEFKGKVFFSQKKFEEALKTFELIEKMNPRLSLAYVANTYIAMKKPEKALEKIEKELRKNPEQYELMADISRIYMIMGKTQEARENARKIISKKPELSVGYITLSLIYQNANETEQAIETLKKAADIKDANIYLLLGNIYHSKKEYSLALEQYNKAEEIKPDFVPAIFQKGAILHSTGKRDKAISEYQKALNFSQNFVPALNNLAYIYAEDNSNLPMALQLAARAYTLSPNDGFVLDTLGFVLLKNKKTDESINALNKALERIQDNPTIYYHLALAYKEKGNISLSVENLKKALAFKDFKEAEQAKSLLNKLQKG